MKLAFSTNAFTRYGLLEAIDAIKEAGFAGVEILADVPHAYRDRIDATFVVAVTKRLEATSLVVSNVNCNCSFGHWKDAPPEPYFEPGLISPDHQHRLVPVPLIIT